MGLNPGYLLKCFLLYQVAFRVCILRVQKNAWSADKNWACFWKIMWFRNDRKKYCGRDLMCFKIEFKLILDYKKVTTTHFEKI